MSRPFSSTGERTETGRVRQRNEDSIRVHRELGLLVLADGMGGHAGGDIASRVAAEAVEQAVCEERSSLKDALSAAHRAVIDAGRAAGAPGMGTTCVAVCLQDGLLEYAWVGDSRVYGVRDGVLERLSRDHSYVQSLVDAGTLSAAAAEVHPERNMLLQCLGGFEDRPPHVDGGVIPVVPGERVLLCSDGLTGELPDTRVEALLAEQPMDRQAASVLVDAALAAGGRDNVTVIVATV